MEEIELEKQHQEALLRHHKIVLGETETERGRRTEIIP